MFGWSLLVIASATREPPEDPVASFGGADVVVVDDSGAEVGSVVVVGSVDVVGPVVVVDSEGDGGIEVPDEEVESDGGSA
jgi:hypothetical protein